MKSKYYVGVRSHGRGLVVFTSKVTPTEMTHGHEYVYTIGPFRTKWGAIVMAKYGSNNPHIQSVADAERIAARERANPSGRFHLALNSQERTRGDSRTKNPGPRSIHTAKWDRCVQDVGGSARSAAAVCTKALGYEGSVKAGHRRKNPTGKLYRLRWHTFHQGSQSVDGTMERLKPVIRHLIKQAIPYKIIDGNGNVVRDIKPLPGGKIRGQFRKPKRLGNPLEATASRPVYYIVEAAKGSESFWLARSGKLVKSPVDAQRFKTVEEATLKTRAHLAKYAPSRKFRFDVKLAY
jgi:hypothetical protein